MLSRVKQKIVDGEIYYLVSDFYFKATSSKRAITTLIDKLPKEDIIYNKKRGRGAACYSNINGLKVMVSKLNRFPIAIKKELGVISLYTSEQEFEYIVNGFLENIGKALDRQVCTNNGYCIDFVVDDIAIEFLEKHHNYDNGRNDNRYLEIKSRYKLLFFKSDDNIGEFLYNLHKELL